MGTKKETKLSQDLAATITGRREWLPGHFRMILKYIKKFNLRLQASSNKHQAPEATSNKRLTASGLWDIIRL